MRAQSFSEGYMAKRNCILCRKHRNDGIIINGKRICKSCEDKLINSEAGNDFYEYYKDCIKKSISIFTARYSSRSCEVHS